MSTKDGRVIAHENETKVLRALSRFGWLRSRDLAALVWQPWAQQPPSAPRLEKPQASVSGLRSVQITLKRMLEARLVLKGKAPNGSVIYALSLSGSLRLRQAGVPAGSGKDLIRSFSMAHFWHRAVSNEIAIAGIVQGFKISTEREIARDRWLGGSIGIAGKKPDVLLRGNGKVWWVEVEKSRKNEREYKALLQWLLTVACDAWRKGGPVLLGDGLHWGKVVFVCSPTFQARLLRDLTAVGWKQTAIDALIQFCPAKLYIGEAIAFA